MTHSILMVTTSCHQIDHNHPTGLWLEEFAVPYQTFKEAGIKVALASPEGGVVPIDPRSLPRLDTPQQWDEALRALQFSVPLNRCAAQAFDAIFLPGGHGTMFDLPENMELAGLLSDFTATDKAIAAVCHGPAGLLSARRADGLPLVAGKRLTAFTNSEERAVELDRVMPFLLESRLRDLGCEFMAAPNWQEHVEVDGKLITGQNPQSSLATAQALLRILNG